MVQTILILFQVLTNYTRLYEGNYTPINPTLCGCNCLAAPRTMVSVEFEARQCAVQLDWVWWPQTGEVMMVFRQQ
jgi:hypothetical protein